MLKMSENLAGVTLLAFGNGSPDIFASLAGSSGDTELVYTELIGAAIFVTGFIAGLVIFYRPFKVVGRNYIRDVLFFIFASIFISNAIHNQHYTIVEGACTVLIYVAYLACVVFDHFQMKREAQKLRRMSDSDSLDESFDIMRKVDVLEDATEIKIYSRRNSNIISDDEILSVFRREFKGDANAGLLKTFLQSLNPLNKEWRDAGWVARAFIVLKVRKLQFALTLNSLNPSSTNFSSDARCVSSFPRYTHCRFRPWRRASRMVESAQHAEPHRTATIRSLHHRIHHNDILRLRATIADCVLHFIRRLFSCLSHIKKRLSSEVPHLSVCCRKFHRFRCCHLCGCQRGCQRDERLSKKGKEKTFNC